ncbi:hypothetical protein H1164_14855 [Thermoactinomyces daqus]|uniref:Uncharacterized protein n=1 Tax=Thermoactinomyces daqus TaxID=1329516 RepID=A0A7W1XCP9_9BACL|nr:hypothetical protein [Thermoactinomyces daqus]MBA4544149.1 hypothetical protein [Thermoactinomyces daqus]
MTQQLYIAGLQINAPATGIFTVLLKLFSLSKLLAASKAGLFSKNGYVTRTAVFIHIFFYNIYMFSRLTVGDGRI